MPSNVYPWKNKPKSFIWKVNRMKSDNKFQWSLKQKKINFLRKTISKVKFEQKYAILFSKPNLNCTPSFRDEFELIWDQILEKLKPNKVPKEESSSILWEESKFVILFLHLKLSHPILKFSFKLDIETNLNQLLSIVESGNREEFVKQLQILREILHSMELIDEQESFKEIQKSILRKMNEFSETIANQFLPYSFFFKQLIVGLIENGIYTKQELREFVSEALEKGNYTDKTGEYYHKQFKLTQISNSNDLQEGFDFELKFNTIWNLIYEHLISKPCESLEEAYQNLKGYDEKQVRFKFPFIEVSCGPARQKFSFEIRIEEEISNQYFYRFEREREFEYYHQELHRFLVIHNTIRMFPNLEKEKKIEIQSKIFNRMNDFLAFISEDRSKRMKQLTEFVLVKASHFISKAERDEMLGEILKN